MAQACARLCACVCVAVLCFKLTHNNRCHYTGQPALVGTPSQELEDDDDDDDEWIYTARHK